MVARLLEVDAEGDAFTAWTLQQMASFAADGHRDWTVIQTARQAVVSASRDRDVVGAARVLLEWVRRSVRYQQDPVGCELVQSPQVTLETRVGDCDDMATLLVALAGAVGIVGRFVAMSERADGIFSHVYAELLTPRGWLGADPTEPRPLGWRPRATRELVQEVAYG